MAADHGSPPAILIGVATCADALLAAPIAAALRGAGFAVRGAWAGSPDGFAAAVALGLPAAAALVAPTTGADAPLAAAAFAAAALSDRPAAVLTLGHSAPIVALALAARAAGVLAVRLGAGERLGDAADADRRLADHAAAAWCTAAAWQRAALLQEGMPADRVAAVGSLFAAALAQRPTLGQGGAHWWLAIEHPPTLGGDAALRALLDDVAAAAAAASRSVRAVPTVLAPALAARRIPLPPAIAFAAADPTAQLDEARAAALLVTDSAGYQELAAAAGTRCVVLPGAAVREDLLASGHVQAADFDVAAALAGAAAVPAPPALPAGADAAIAAAVATWLQPVARPGHSARPGAPLALPSDADASGRTFGAGELANVAAVLRTGTLNSTRGTFVTRFEREFAAWLGRRHAIACASGTAAIHAALAALRLAAGDEVITSPITDMGALLPISYEGGVPVFADVDPDSLNITADSVAANWTSRTRAVVVTHLFGRPAAIDEIAALARDRGVPVIEDAAQAYGATLHGRRAGTFGALAAFSLQQGKHITTGEGGVVATDDDELARRVTLFVNKAWGYGDADPDHYFPALNYRLGELAGAVACAQLPKLDRVVARRRAVAAALRSALAAVPGLGLPGDPPGGTHAWWRFPLRVDSNRIRGGAVALGRRLRDLGVAAVPRYVQKPAFECAVWTAWRDSPVTWMPLQHNPRGAAPGPLYDRRRFPGAVRGLEQVVVLPINERWSADHVAALAGAIRAAAEELGLG